MSFLAWCIWGGGAMTWYDLARKDGRSRLHATVSALTWPVELGNFVGTLLYAAFKKEKQ